MDTLSTLYLIHALRAGHTTYVIQALIKRLEMEWREEIGKRVVDAFAGELEWANHPEQIDYSWRHARAGTVAATARYRGKEYSRLVSVPRLKV